MHFSTPVLKNQHFNSGHFQAVIRLFLAFTRTWIHLQETFWNALFQKFILNCHQEITLNYYKLCFSSKLSLSLLFCWRIPLNYKTLIGNQTWIKNCCIYSVFLPFTVIQFHTKVSFKLHYLQAKWACKGCLYIIQRSCKECCLV